MSRTICATSHASEQWSAPIRLNTSTERTNQGAAMAIDPRNGALYVTWRQFDLAGGDNDAVGYPDVDS